MARRKKGLYLKDPLGDGALVFVLLGLLRLLLGSLLDRSWALAGFGLGLALAVRHRQVLPGVPGHVVLVAEDLGALPALEHDHGSLEFSVCCTFGIFYDTGWLFKNSVLIMSENFYVLTSKVSVCY